MDLVPITMACLLQFYDLKIPRGSSIWGVGLPYFSFQYKPTKLTKKKSKFTAQIAWIQNFPHISMISLKVIGRRIFNKCEFKKKVSLKTLVMSMKKALISLHLITRKLIVVFL